MLATLLSLTVLVAAAVSPAPEWPAGFDAPPWEATADETIVERSPAFATCAQLIGDLVRRAGNHLVEQHDFTSPRWGDIVRARFLAGRHGPGSVFLVTCWSARGGPARVAVRPERMF